MTHFLDWRAARVEWEAIDAQHDARDMDARYRRGLDPAWYFGPMEQYADATGGRLPDRHGRHAMNIDDRYLIVRAASIYVAVMLLALAWVRQAPARPRHRGRDARLHSGTCRRCWLFTCWPIAPAGGDSMPRRIAAGHAGGSVARLGVPVGRDSRPGLSSWPLAGVVALALAVDLVLMPAASPVVQLGPPGSSASSSDLLSACCRLNCSHVGPRATSTSPGAQRCRCRLQRA